MESKSHRVELTCRQRSIYFVDAADSEAAKQLASERWRRGDPSDVAGFDWQELEWAAVTPVPDPISQAQDDEVVLRFVQERESLLLKLGSSLVGASVNDAISAAQTAPDLGWFRQDGAPDIVRAAEALERLCAKKQLVSFRRVRVRSNERGDILLYCTPRYLEQLASEVNEEVVRAYG